MISDFECYLNDFSEFFIVIYVLRIRMEFPLFVVENNNNHESQTRVSVMN